MPGTICQSSNEFLLIINITFYYELSTLLVEVSVHMRAAGAHSRKIVDIQSARALFSLYGKC